MIRYVLPVFVLLSCSTQIPDYEPMQAQVSSEDGLSSAGNPKHNTKPEYWAPTLRGEWSSGRMWSVSSSIPYSFPGLSQAISAFSSSSNAAQGSSSSMEIVEIVDGPLSWKGECGEKFGVSEGLHDISWEMMNCSSPLPKLFCATVTGESCGASITFDSMTYYAGVGEEFQLGVQEKIMAGGILDAVCDLVCWLQ